MSAPWQYPSKVLPRTLLGSLAGAWKHSIKIAFPLTSVHFSPRTQDKAKQENWRLPGSQVAMPTVKSYPNSHSYPHFSFQRASSSSSYREVAMTPEPVRSRRREGDSNA